MDDMAEEFGEMLRETLEKMRERIEISSNNYEGADVQIQQVSCATGKNAHYT